jgi:ABC-type nitrate/sulfonate/bicarbonate transport system substrate-binding protein
MKSPVMAAMALAMVVGCTEKSAPLVSEPLTIAVGTLPHFALIHVAQAKGYFAAEGLAVTLQPHPFGKVALDALIAGKADLATCAAMPLVFAELGGSRLSVLSSISTSTRSSALVARKAAGISKGSDLTGKRIGVTLGTSGDFFLDTFMLRHGVDRKAVRFVNLTPGEMAGAIERGDVDAVAIWEPTVRELQKRFGGGVTTFFEEALLAELSVLVGRRGFAQQRPEVAKRVLRALLSTEAFFRERPEEARQAAVAMLGGERRELEEMLRLFDFRVRLDQSLLVLMEDEGRWARRTGKSPNGDLPNFRESLDAEPLLAVRPEAVGIIR